jgi:hypothetical protein
MPPCLKNGSVANRAYPSQRLLPYRLSFAITIEGNTGVIEVEIKNGNTYDIARRPG